MLLYLQSPGSCRDNEKERYKDFTFDHSYWSYEPTDENYASQEEVYNLLYLKYTTQQLNIYRC